MTTTWLRWVSHLVPPLSITSTRLQITSVYLVSASTFFIRAPELPSPTCLLSLVPHPNEIWTGESSALRLESFINLVPTHRLTPSPLHHCNSTISRFLRCFVLDAYHHDLLCSRNSLCAVTAFLRLRFGGQRSSRRLLARLSRHRRNWQCSLHVLC